MQKMLQAATKKPTYLKGSSDAIFSKAIPLALGAAAAGAVVRVLCVLRHTQERGDRKRVGVELPTRAENDNRYPLVSHTHKLTHIPPRLFPPVSHHP